MKRGAKRQTTPHSWQTGTRGSRGQRWGLSGWRVQLRAMRSAWSHPRVTPRVGASTRSHPEHIWAWFRHGSRVLCRGRTAAVSPVCLSFINLIPTSLWPPRWTRDWQARKALLGPDVRKKVHNGRMNRALADWFPFIIYWWFIKCIIWCEQKLSDVTIIIIMSNNNNVILLMHVICNHYISEGWSWRTAQLSGKTSKAWWIACISFLKTRCPPL